MNMALPIGNDLFIDENYTPDFRFIFEKGINEWVGFGSNIGVEWDNGKPALIYTAVLGFSVFENTGAFIEIYGDAPKYSKASHLIDGGLTYNITNNLQLDASVGYALTEWTEDMFVNAGVSFRLPE
jgi:outer membrane putative beta-barrel porin/alpha-amylase